MRTARESDFFIDLPEVGMFRFGKRTFRDRADIKAAYLRYAKEWGDEDQELAAYSSMLAVYKILCVECPSGWENVEDMEVTETLDNKLFELFRELSAKEEQFRKGASEGGETTG